jgi:hypothetical protein
MLFIILALLLVYTKLTPKRFRPIAYLEGKGTGENDSDLSANAELSAKARRIQSHRILFRLGF